MLRRTIRATVGRRRVYFAQIQRSIDVFVRLSLVLSAALQAACDSVNSGLLTPLYNMHAYRLASLLLAPCILPLDVTVVLIRK